MVGELMRDARRGAGVWMLAAAAAVGFAAACTSPTEDTRTGLFVIDSGGASITTRGVRLTGSVKDGWGSFPGSGSGVGISYQVHYEWIPSSDTSSTSFYSCPDVRLYTEAVGGTLAYSRNAATGGSCPSGRIPIGPVQTEVWAVGNVAEEPVRGQVADGIYFVRIRLLVHPDSAAVEVPAGIVRLR